MLKEHRTILKVPSFNFSVADGIITVNQFISGTWKTLNTKTWEFRQLLGKVFHAEYKKIKIESFRR